MIGGAGRPFLTSRRNKNEGLFCFLGHLTISQARPSLCLTDNLYFLTVGMNEIIHAPEEISLDGPFVTGPMRIVHTRHGQPERYGLTTAFLFKDF
jgi:hypothetical protein